MLLAILKAIAAVPKLYSIADKLINLIFGVWTEIKKGQASEQFKKGEEIARKEKNTCELEKAFNPDKRCD